MSMFKTYRKEVTWGGRKLVLETGKIARQANGAVLATYGDYGTKNRGFAIGRQYRTVGLAGDFTSL